MPGTSDRDPTGRFTDRATDYARYRPTYPAAAISAVLEGLGPPGTLVAVDVGAGTGISARLLADRGARVFAVEPNLAMRQTAEPHERVTFVDGTAEAIPLPDAAADLVLAAQAFHWFRAEEAVRELARVLKRGGRLALVWNRRSTRDPLTVGFRDALLAAGADPAIEAMDADVDAVGRSGLFRPYFGHHQAFDRAGLVGRAQSASYAPKTGPGAERLVALLNDLHARHADANGMVRLLYETEVLLATRR